MDSEVYKFSKTFEERLDNLNTILLDTDDNPGVPEILRIWSNYLELSIEPLGWKALWYISRRCCNELKITFPAIVVVTVEYIEFSDLTANVTVLEVEDVEESNKIPAKVNDVPLKELYITINQDYEGPDFSITAESLDNYRFFYNHLWWPWDEEDSTTENWIELHFLFRLKLFYDMLNMNMHYVTAKTIKLLIEKGKEVYNNIEDIQNELDGVKNDSESLDDPRVVQLIKLTEELDSIKKQLSHWENPELRKSLNADIQKRYNVKGIVVVIPECSITEAAKYFDQASKLGSEGELYKRTTNTLKEALLHYIQGDTIIVAPSSQTVSGNEHLGHNVTIKGLSSKTVPKITDSRSHWCLFESIGDNIVMNNLLIEIQSSRTAIAIKGTTFLDSVSFKNTNENSMSAIIVHSKGTLVAAKCHFEDFNVAILCLKGATLHLMECTFNNNDVCIKVENGSEMVIENCDLSKTKSIPIQFKDDSAATKCTSSLEFVNSLEGINLSSVKVADTQKVVQVL